MRHRVADTIAEQESFNRRGCAGSACEMEAVPCFLLTSASALFLCTEVQIRLAITKGHPELQAVPHPTNSKQQLLRVLCMPQQDLCTVQSIAKSNLCLP